MCAGPEVVASAQGGLTRRLWRALSAGSYVVHFLSTVVWCRFSIWGSGDVAAESAGMSMLLSLRNGSFVEPDRRTYYGVGRIVSA